MTSSSSSGLLEWLRELFDRVVVFAAQNPGTFLYYVLLGLTPLFLVSAVLSWKLAKHLEKDEKEKKRKAKREAGIAKARSNASLSDKSSASSSPSSKNAKTTTTQHHQQQPNKNKGRQKGHNKRD